MAVESALSTLRAREAGLFRAGCQQNLKDADCRLVLLRSDDETETMTEAGREIDTKRDRNGGWQRSKNDDGDRDRQRGNDNY